MARARVRFTAALEDIERSIRAEASRLAYRNRRRHGRVKPRSLWCNLGLVLDVSASGVRLHTRRELHGVRRVRIHDGARQVEVQGRVAWSKRLRFRSYLTGIEFVAVDPESAATLRSIAVFG